MKLSKMRIYQMSNNEIAITTALKWKDFFELNMLHNIAIYNYNDKIFCYEYQVAEFEIEQAIKETEYDFKSYEKDVKAYGRQTANIIVTASYQTYFETIETRLKDL